MAKKKSSPRHKKAATKSKAAPQSATKVKGKKPSKVPAKKKAEATLGRPKVTGEEQLYMLFHEDYHSRQIFDFLRVQTVKELEQYSPQQIVKLLSKPINDTVNRIRRKLAEKNRYLQDDIGFAVDFQRQNEE